VVLEVKEQVVLKVLQAQKVLKVLQVNLALLEQKVKLV
jgi:hypothetical protein